MFGKKKKDGDDKKNLEENLTFWEKFKKEFWSYVLIFVVVFGIRSSIFDNNHIPSGSMLPTMAIGDFIIVNKMAFGLRIPYSDYLGKSLYLTSFWAPKRGDIVVFEFPLDRGVLYVKRVIGIPGDEIEVDNNNVYINGELVIGTESEDSDDLIALFDDKFSPETLKLTKVKHGSHEFVRAAQNAALYHKNTDGKFIVPKESVFVMGDNRDYSSDSRVWGVVPYSHLRGRPLFVWFNMVYPWSDEKFHFRPWRIGTLF